MDPMPARRTPGVSRRPLLGALAGAWLGAGAAARAATYPQRPLRLVVPYSVGVGPDVVARGLAEQLQALWGQAVVVDNKPGAAGILAFADVRRVAADGHTLYLADIGTLAVNPLLHAQLPYDVARDLEPLTLLFRATFVLWTGAAPRHRSIGALLEAARREPGRISYASLGHGHPSQVAVEGLARAAEVRLLHVPYRDAGTLLSAVSAGEVDFTAFSHHTVAGLAARGRLLPLATAARQRLPTLPGVPTLGEAGAPMVEMHPWAALVTVAGTPAAVLEPLRSGLIAAIESPALRALAEQAGFELTPSSPQALRERIAADTADVRPLVAEGRITRP